MRRKEHQRQAVMDTKYLPFPIPPVLLKMGRQRTGDEEVKLSPGKAGWGGKGGLVFVFVSN